VVSEVRQSEPTSRYLTDVGRNSIVRHGPVNALGTHGFAMDRPGNEGYHDDFGIESSGQERRGRVRAGIAWGVRFLRGGEAQIPGRTLNVSAGGFYCVSEGELTLGEHCCVLLIPANAPNDSSQFLYLHCQIEVLRVEPLENLTFGIAARICSYRAVTDRSKKS